MTDEHRPGRIAHRLGDPMEDNLRVPGGRAERWTRNPECGTLGCLANHETAAACEFDAAMREQIALSEEIVSELIFEEVTCEDAT